MSYIKKYFFLIVVLLFPLKAEFAQSINNAEAYKKLNGTHDLSLPDWGPYSKRYIGISHIPDKASGLRFDLSVFPGFYRRKVDVPNVLFESGYHPWEASPNLEYFSFRHELEWKDQVYTDISYSAITPQSRLIRIECVNNTELNQSLALHFMAFMNFPPIKEYSPYTPIYPAVINLPAGAKWIDALDYEDLKFSKIRPTDNLVADGKMRGEIRADGFVNGSGIGSGFGMDKGDFVSYKIIVDNPVNNAVLYCRYRMDAQNELTFSASGLTNQDIIFKGKVGLDINKKEDGKNRSGAHSVMVEPDLDNIKNEFSTIVVNLGDLKAGKYELSLTSNGGNAIEFDGFSIVEAQQVDQINIQIKNWNPVPKIIQGPLNNSVILKYDDVDLYYGLLWQYDMFDIREWYGRDLSDYFKQMVNEHVQKKFYGEGKGHFTNIFLRPVELEPKSRKIIYGVVCSGSKEEVESLLKKAESSKDYFGGYYLAARKHLVNKPVNPEGEKYKFSIDRMNATLFTNVVYPVYTQKEYIRHSAPGRWWDCLYTWDSGFNGLGLLESDTTRAIESLNAYVQEPGAQSAFIHHGSPVPVQHYLFQELWNATQSKEMIEYFYPRLKQYHEFFAGRLGSSTTREFKSNILKTWDYFYNSGGWDDLPPQKYTHDEKLESTVAPVITSSQAIRTAKILKMFASYLGKKEDIKAYDNDIKTFTNALQKYSWDEESGYFGYVVHDGNGNPLRIMKYEDKVNYDMTFDGAYPLIAGICTDEQKEKILASLKSDKHIWSKTGLSAVDQSAPYYRIDGYWNGTVWMSHQWFFWKTMFDLGEADFAFKIAQTALDVWKTETEGSYNCMEHFIIETGRGAGWHQFGALSSPVIIWYSSYFCPGNFTAGFDTWIDNKKFNADNSGFSAELSFTGNSKTISTVACMNPKYDYTIKWNGIDLVYKTFAKGTLSIDIPSDKVKKGKLEITKMN
jgi:hypothetical protein